jgi:hypothetical protein
MSKRSLPESYSVSEVYEKESIHAAWNKRAGTKLF